MSNLRAEFKSPDKLLILKFYAPRFGNSLGLEDARAISSLLKKHKSTRGLIFISEDPRFFCSGGRLSDNAKHKNRTDGLKVNAEITRHLEFLVKWPGLKLAAVNGDCYGGGMELISCFDLRWVTSGALMGFWQRRIGLTTGWGGGSRWAQILGENQVRSLMLSGDVFGAGEALRMGLVDRVVMAEKIFASATEWMQNSLRRGEVIPTAWTAKGEQKIFSKLWWNSTHREVLKKWK